MLLPGKISLKSWLIFTVFLSYIVLCQSSKDDRYSTSRDFERYRRSADETSSEKVNKPNPKAESSDSNSDSDSEEKKADSEEKPAKKSLKSKSDDNEAESDEEDFNESGNRRSTRGLRTDDFEPDDNARIHGKYKGDDADSDASDRRRRRRSIGRFDFQQCEP